MWLFTFWVSSALWCLSLCGKSHVYVDKDGGYRNLKIAVGSDVVIGNCTEFHQKIQSVVESFSKTLWFGTKEKLKISTVDVILPRTVAQRCSVTEIGQHDTWNTADIRISQEWHIQRQWGPEGSEGVGVHQPLGCAKEAEYISLHSDVLDQVSLTKSEDDQTSTNSSDEDMLQTIGDSLLAAWARYRWGIFEERQYEDDPQYTPSDLLEEVNQSMANQSFHHNTTDNNQTEDESIMKILSHPPKKSVFCDSKSHDGLAPNPQNLICRGRSSWEIMNEHPDFIQNIPGKPWEFTEPGINKDYWLQASIPNPNQETPIRMHEYFAEYFEESSLQPDPQQNPKQSSGSFTGASGGVRLQKREVEEPKAEEGVLKPEEGMVPTTTSIQNLIPEDRQSDKIGSVLETENLVSWVSSKTPATPQSTTKSVTWVRNDRNKSTVPDPLHVGAPSGLRSLTVKEPAKPTVKFVSAPPKVVVVALDLSSPSIAQSSVERLKGGLFRWLFGIGQAMNVGILASYSNTSFPLSLGPLSPGPVSAHQLEEHLALLPYQHEIDSNVYGGLYCLSCIMDEAAKMLQNSGVPLSSGTLVLVACKPDLPSSELSAATQYPIAIHTVAICPNAPLSLEYLAVPEGSWALSPARMGKGSAAETQLSRILTEITKETVLWPDDPKLHVVLEEEKLLREDNVERVGPYRRVKGSVTLKKGSTPRLIIVTTSSPAKVAELNLKGKRIPFNRDTPKRFWALMDSGYGTVFYSLKFLSTSLELPLTVTMGVYDRSDQEGIRVRLRTSTRKYDPDSTENPYLIVWAEVTKEGRSVLDADVTLSLTYLSGIVPSTYSLRLLDDGSTEPDIRKEDGIYSRYLTWTPGKGRYVLTATASSTSASTVKYFTKDGKLKSERTGHFTSASTSISVIVEEAPTGDIFPPSRITDLRAQPLGDGFVNITWTAPGGDLDQGSAWKYSLKMYTDFSALKDKFESSGIDVFCIQGDERVPTPAPSLFGTPQHCLTSVPFSNLRWYFALRAIDGANNTGSISNIVSTFIQEPGTTVSSKRTDDKNASAQTVLLSTVPPGVIVEDILPASPRGTSTWQMYLIAIISAIIFVMVAIVVFACIICCRKARARTTKEQDRPIYKIYVNNAYIQEDDGEIKVVGKNPTLDDKEHTQWVNSLEKFGHPDTSREEPVDIGDNPQDTSGNNKFVKPVRFGVLTNGSIMREPPPSSSSSSSKPSEETTNDDFKYKDLSETISNSTAEEGATGSTSSGGATDPGPEPHHLQQPRTATYIPPLTSQYPGVHYEIAYPPLGIPPIPGTHSVPHLPHRTGYGRSNEYSSDEEGGFRPRSMAEPKFQRHITPQFSSFRYAVPSNPVPDHLARRPFDYPPSYDSVSRVSGAPLPHGTVRSVKKRRHISFV